jgi:hypothetical protein
MFDAVHWRRPHRVIINPSLIQGTLQLTQNRASRATAALGRGLRTVFVDAKDAYE